MSTSTTPHVIIVGGGFAGVAALRALRHAPVTVTLIDRHIYNTFQPLLYQVATSGLNPGDVTFFLRSLRRTQPNASFYHGLLTRIHADKREIELHDGETMAYDYLVLANGVGTNFFGTPGAEEYSKSLYSRSQAMRIRDELFTQMEKAAASEGDAEVRVVIAGGGATGVEMAGALAELRDQALRDAYPELRADSVTITLVHRGAELLKPFAGRLRRYAAKSLRKRNVVLRFGAGVTEVTETGVCLSDGNTIPAELVIWATGVTAHPEVAEWGVPQTQGGRITVDATLAVTGRDRIYAAGDIAASPDDLAQLAQPAIQGGDHIGRQIARDLEGLEPETFVYHDKGTMATIGRYSAVVQLSSRTTMTGFPAWLLWVGIHIYSLLGNGNRVATMVRFFLHYGGPWYKRAVPIVGEVRPVRPNGDRP
ncbi:NAD(P)/FAD-dependent oxidoreductase [Frondihabitans cladoniiphilus]|uniref:NAD(P)/FAD-dependent oxidoreductase n=1 Tax=Frondihabitans cladoniiphilus TaxID=715785 RepID=A0ABP8VIF7_9MICO